MKQGTKGIPEIILILLLLPLFASCALFPKKIKSYDPGYQEVGVASWYGPGFHGKTTSSGEVYDMHGYSAAHRTMPFGTYLMVRHLENGQRVRVIVNDRGPFIRGRMLDLSYGAAEALGMVQEGIAPIEIRVIGQATDAVPFDRGQKTEAYSIQVGSFAREANALRLKQSLERNYKAVYVLDTEVQGRVYFRVRVGKFRTLEQADRQASRLSRLENLQTFVVRED